MKKIFLALAMLGATTTPAFAADIIGLYNTGVSSSGAKLASGGVDSHYLVNNGGSYVYNNGLYTQSPTAGFVSGQPNGGGGSNTYTLTFFLTGLNAASATLSGQVAYDNALVVTLNGNPLYIDFPTPPASASAFGAFENLHNFSATGADFLSGENKLSFAVTNYGLNNPSGVLVTSLAGTASAVPETATWIMMLLGFGMIGFGLRRRAKVSTSVRLA